MSLYLGVDTSNYTTSAAVFDDEAGEVSERRMLLKVKSGEKGLRQSDALYAHVKNLPGVLSPVLDGQTIRAVGFSARPRDQEGSYMPCFEAGALAAHSISAAMHIPNYDFSHQAGHIASALFSANRLDLLRSRLIAFHVSGGTTEAVLCTPGQDVVPHMEIMAQSLDLKAGQAVDRVGQMLGLGFPAGPEFDRLALQSGRTFRIRPCLKGADCCLSGLENQCAEMLRRGEEACDVARFCVEFIKATLEGMLRALEAEGHRCPVLFAGGVMANTIIRGYFIERYGAVFAQPRFSSDNAVGIAVLTKMKVVCE